MRFTGQYNHSLDTKGRVIIPSGFREKLGDRFMVARGMEKCITVYSMEAWERLEEKDTRRMMHEAIARLKPRERQLFELRQMEELSTEEISAQTGILKSSVSAMVSAARKKVYEELLKRLRQ